MPESARTESISPFIHRKVVVLREGATVYEAARAMRENNVGSVVVSDGEGHMTGIVTDRDLTCAMVSMSLTPESELIELMTRSPATVDECATVMDVIALMKSLGVRRIPVVHRAKNSGSERCIGMVSLDDLIVAKMISMDDVSQIVRSQVFRKTRATGQQSAEPSRALPADERFFMQFENQTGLAGAQARSFVEFVMALVVRRLHFSSAASLISFLPAGLRTELLDLPAGPDGSITGSRIIKETATRFDISPEEATRRIQAIGRGFNELRCEGLETEFSGSLPEDIRTLLTALPEGNRGDAGFRSSTEARI